MDRIDDKLNAARTPIEGASGGSHKPVCDSHLVTPAETCDSRGVTLDVDEPCRITVQPLPRAKKNLVTPCLILGYDEYAHLEGINRDTIFKRWKAGKLHRIDTGRRVRGGKIVWGIPLDQPGVSASARARWQAEHRTNLGADGTSAADPAAPSSHEEQHVSAEVATVGVVERGRHPAASALLPLADSRGEAIARFNRSGIPVLKSDPTQVWEAGLVAAFSPHAVEEFWRRRRAVAALDLAQAANGHGGKLDAARRVAREHHLNASCTLLTWQRNHRRHGEAALVPKWKKDGGSKTIPKRLQAQVEAFYAQGGGHDEIDRPTIAQCYRYARDLVVERYHRHGHDLDIPSYHAVRRLIEAICERRPMLVEAARHGKKHFSDKFEFHVRRDPQAIPLGACFCLDHRVMDTHVIAPSGRICRPWFSAIADIHSADLAGWVLREQVTSDAVASAFRRAILGFAILNESTGEWIEFPAHGVPQHAYLDHGKEFHGGAMKDRVAQPPSAVSCRGGRFSKQFSHSPKDLALDQAVSETLFSGLGIHRVTAIRYSARSKPIEPIFGSFATRIENLIAGHCGRNTADKPEQLEERRKRGELLSWTQFLGVLASAIQVWRHERPIGRDRDKTPAEYWEHWQGELPDPARLDTLLLRKEGKRLRGCGIEIQQGRETFHYVIDDPEFALLSGAIIPALWSQDDIEACIAVHPVSGRRIVVPRVDLRDKSWDMMLGGEMPDAHKLVKRAVGKQKQLVAGYRRWASDQRDPALADPTGSIRIASQNGREIRGVVRDIRREAEDARTERAPERRIEPTPAPATRYRDRPQIDILAAVTPEPAFTGATADAELACDNPRGDDADGL